MKWADLTATTGQFSWPPVGSYMTTYGHFSMAADTTASPDGHTPIFSPERAPRKGHFG